MVGEGKIWSYNASTLSTHILSIHFFFLLIPEDRESTLPLNELFTLVNWVLYIMLLVRRIGNVFVSSRYVIP